MNYPYEEGIDSDDNNLDFRIYNDVAVDLESSYSDSSDNDILVPGRRRKIRKLSSNSSKEIFNEDIIPQRFEFSTGTKTPGPQVHNLYEPIEYFRLFFTNALIEDITLETNLYARHILRDRILSKCSMWNDWCEVEFEEMKAFLGVILNMAQDIRTRVQKINNFIEYLDEKFREYFVPGKEVSINEAVVKVKGRISFINYNPQKPTKWGIRIFVLADAKSAYVYGILPYYGKLTSQDFIKPDLPVSSRIVLHLCNKLLHSFPGCAGYHVYTDRYCTSLVLAEELLQMKSHITGTI
ncbi:piggyBac transposable element-derived protein 4-like [Bombus flavifrons]|uniref:piggyBac transposable element-derived protein 4-like n=1 Tax=Bombus flavifrons TaxID=103934 RepID=UPI00370445B3